MSLPNSPLKSTKTPDRPGPEDGGVVLDAVEAFHRRFNVFPSEAAYTAVVLWDAHTHLLDCFESTPRIAFLSPEPGSGKTRALEIMETVAPRPVLTTDVSPAALFRTVSDADARPTVLFDEIDTVFGPKAAGNEDLRGLINSGHRRSGVVLRCVGEGGTQTVQPFPVYAALAMGGLGDLPDTIMSRSVIIRMRRRAPNEDVEPYRERVHKPQGNALRERLAAWADSVRDQLHDVWPELPEGISDRPADVWEPLIAVADAAGGHWPERARTACVQLVTASKANDKGSVGIRLLTDLRDIFDGAERMLSAELLSRLAELDDAPWADLDGKPITARALAKMLGDYVTADNDPIKPRNIKTGPKSSAKGYYASDLSDAWLRYCPPRPPRSQESATAATAATAQVRPLFPVADTPEVADTDPLPAVPAASVP
ncbi:DUF3631 domain-containing protein [Kitasatospora aureofaciens]|uniref:DUF3631 domain-containing protein n=1 Tax=Kitasatospora aureofaciens TaxID=1894 RepID=UPI001DED3076|nr:DUF3631 domain-containing protein [Kitasatospora aureofaciens]HJD84170.1 DUF3631 domain-containing protein [Kitasatospora aureofaciens]